MKRKNAAEDNGIPPVARPRKHSKTNSGTPDTLQVQIVTGSYDKVLHGAIATLPDPEVPSDPDTVDKAAVFEDNFKFNAHRSAIRCLAVSPLPSPDDGSEARRIFLASGGTDGCVNVYQIDSAAHHEPKRAANSALPNGNDFAAVEFKNEEVGSLVHHSSYINALEFASRSKLLSAADDSTIAVSRTRDWTVLTTLKAPIPRAVGRPSGDTAPDGAAPSGIKDFSIHPSKKLMISVGKGERCMRLWNLVTGKKAGVLTFDRNLLHAVGERRGAKGEGSFVEWNSRGDQFTVVFERGAAAFNMDCKPESVLHPASSNTRLHPTSPGTKLHRVRYLPENSLLDVLVAGTEDGRLIFASSAKIQHEAEHASEIPEMQVIGEVGGEGNEIFSRIKDFDIIRCSTQDLLTTLLMVTASSDGSVRMWHIALTVQDNTTRADSLPGSIPTSVKGSILGTYATEDRITCMKAFLMYPTSGRNPVKDDSLAPNLPATETYSPSISDEQNNDEEFEGLGSDDG